MQAVCGIAHDHRSVCTETIHAAKSCYAHDRYVAETCFADLKRVSAALCVPAAVA